MKNSCEKPSSKQTTHLCIEFEIVLGSLLCYITMKLSQNFCCCIDFSFIQQISMHQSRKQLFTLVWQRMPIEKAWNNKTPFSSLLTLRVRRDLFTQTVLSPQLRILSFLCLCFSAVLHLTHLPLGFIVCLGQVYESWESFKVNDVLEVFGVLSVDPVLSIVNSEDR